MLDSNDIFQLKFDPSVPDKLEKIEEVEYPVIAIVGKRGSGKTLLMTSLTVDMYFEQLEKVKAYKEGRYTLKKDEPEPKPLKIFSNYPLYKIPYTYITYKDVLDLPDYLQDGLVLFDEILVGADAYKPFNKSNEAINMFVSQMRKRRCTLMYTGQVFTQATKRLRLQTNYLYQCIAIGVRGYVNLQIFKIDPFEQLRDQDLDLRAYFKYYDTNFVVHFE